MEHPLLPYLTPFGPLEEADVQAIEAHVQVKTIEKGTVLLEPEQVALQCYFILSGCIRQYVLDNGLEKTTAFYTEGQAVAALGSATTRTPAGMYWVCVETTTAVFGSMDEQPAIFQQFPKLEQLTRLVMEQGFGKMQEEFARFIISTPEERYAYLLESRPGLLQRVPQHQLASYIGVTPESLSRIRKRLSKRN